MSRRAVYLILFAVAVAAGFGIYEYDKANGGFPSNRPRVDVPGELERRLYVAKKDRVVVFDIDEGHSFCRTIFVGGDSRFKGICCSVSLGRLYLSNEKTDELICVDLKTETVLWKRVYGTYPDSMAITPDGLTVVLPIRESKDWRWVFIDAETGDELGSVAIGKRKRPAEYRKKFVHNGPDWTESRGPHNTWMDADGSRVYFGAFTANSVFVADVEKREIIGEIGPFSHGVRPFVVDEDEERCFSNVDGLLGFEVAAVKNDEGWGGGLLHRVEATTPSARVEELGILKKLPHHVPSHGIAITPDGREVWVVDGGYGLLYVYDVTGDVPRNAATIALYEVPNGGADCTPDWITFGIDGRYVYSSTGHIIDTATREIVGVMTHGEKRIEIDFIDGEPVAASRR